MTDNKSPVLLGVGDVGPVHGDMEDYATLAQPALDTGDIRFAQCERLYYASDDSSDSNTINVDLGHRPLQPHQISIFTDSGFDIVSLAGNHTMEWGGEIALATKSLFEKKGIQVVGVGRDLAEACEPAIIERNGVRVAFVAYCSVLRDGHEAGHNKAGVAPMRARTSYEPAEWQAGMPPRIITVPLEEDVARMQHHISEAKKSAHAVVLSLHWGLHYVPRAIAEYQPIVARAAFDAGADVILGHHPHVPKAIEARDSKVCFYSLGNFMFSTNTGLKPGFVEKMRRYGVEPDLDEYPHCPHGADSHRSLIAKAVLSQRGLEKASFLPVHIDRQLRPEPLTRDDSRFDKIVSFMEWASAGFDHDFTVDNDEVMVTSTR